MDRLSRDCCGFEGRFGLLLMDAVALLEFDSVRVAFLDCNFAGRSIRVALDFDSQQFILVSGRLGDQQYPFFSLSFLLLLSFYSSS